MATIYNCIQVPSEHVADTMIVFSVGDGPQKPKGPFCSQCADEWIELHAGVTPYNPTGEIYQIEKIPLGSYLESHAESLENYPFKEIR